MKMMGNADVNMNANVQSNGSIVLEPGINAGAKQGSGFTEEDMDMRTSIENGVNASIYPGIRVYEKDWMKGEITLPPLGIIVKKSSTNTALKQHEYGHKLAYDKVGFWKYYFNIGIPSLYNTIENSLDEKSGANLSVPHHYYYTETDANTRAQEYFGPDAAINKWPNNTQTREAEYPALIRGLMYMGWGITELLFMPKAGN